MSNAPRTDLDREAMAVIAYKAWRDTPPEPWSEGGSHWPKWRAVVDALAVALSGNVKGPPA